MFKSTLSLGRILGIQVGFHYSWLIIFLLMTLSLNAYFTETHEDWAVGVPLVTAVVTSLLFFSSIVLHELGHSVIAMSRGIRVRSITLFIFGGMAETEKEADSPASEFWIAIAGPAVSFILAALFYLLFRIFGPFSEAVAEACRWLASINLVLAVFNLLPGFPLDGGRVFRALIWRLSGDAGTGMRWAVAAGRMVAYGLVVLGLVTMLRTGQILNGVWLMAIGLFLLTAAEASGTAYGLTQVLKGIKAEDVMRADVPIVSGDMKVVEWLDKHVLRSADRAYLVGEQNSIRGIVTLSDCKQLPAEQWPRTDLRQVMTPVDELRTVDADSDVEAVLRLMTEHSLNQVPVMDSGVVVGWIDRDRLLKIIRLHAEAGK